MQPIRRNCREIERFRAAAREPIPMVVHGSIERAYWRTHFGARDYVDPNYGFRAYEPAYRYGWEFRAGYGAADWRAAERELAAGWPRYKGDCPLTWEEAAPAVRDGYLHAGKHLVAA